MATVLERFRPTTVKNDTQFVLERDVPIPKHTGRGRAATYPFRDMEVGDSFFVTTSRPKTHPVRRAASAFAARHGGKFCTRRTDEGVRVWRFA